jgi:hypothetical protein
MIDMTMETDLVEVVKLQRRFHELEDGDDRDSIGVTGDLMAGEFVENYHAEIQRNAEDAARYRWLVDNTALYADSFYHDGRDSCSTRQPLDNAIDAAMRSANGEEVKS